MTVTTLVATPDPEPFDIHAQPTWIALGIGRVRRQYLDFNLKPTSVWRLGATAWVDFEGPNAGARACLVKDDDSGIGRISYVDEVTR